MSMSRDEDSSQTSFTTGFTVGLFAGAAGYYLFGTKQGAVLRRQLLKDWEEAKEHLVEEGVISHNNVSLRGLFKELVHQAVSEGEKVEERLLSVEGSKKTPKSSPRKRETSKRFKGV